MKPDALLLILFALVATAGATLGVLCLAYGAGDIAAGCFGGSVAAVIAMLFEAGTAEMGEPEARLQYWRCCVCGERCDIHRMVNRDGLRCPACADSGLDAPFEARR